MTAATQDPSPSGLDLLERWLDYRDAWLATHEPAAEASQRANSNQ
jgi:hypothetical protein